MKGVLMGAGLGAGINMLRGKDPLQGAMMGGIGGGLASGFSGALANAGATTAGGTMAGEGASMMMNEAVRNAGTPALGGILGNSPLDDAISNIGSKGLGLLEEHTGITNKDLNTMALTTGIDMATEGNPDNTIRHESIQNVKADYPVEQAPSGNLNVLGPQEAETFGLGTDPEIIQKTLYEDPRYRVKRARIGGI